MKAATSPNGAALVGAPGRDTIPYTVASDVAPLWDDAAQQCATSFMEWLTDEARARHMPVTDARVYRWQSIEDPRDENLVIEADVQGNSQAAAAFWGAACDELGRLIQQNRTPTTELLTVGLNSR